MEEGWTWLSIDCLIFLYYSSAVHFQHTDRVGQSLKHRISGHLGYWFLLIFAYQQSGSLQLRLARTARTKLRKVGMIGSGWARSHKSKIYKFFLRTTPQNARSNNPADLTTTGSSWIKTDCATKTLQTSEFVFICFWDWSTILAAGCGIRTHSVAHHSNDSVLKAAKKFQFDYEILRKKTSATWTAQPVRWDSLEKTLPSLASSQLGLIARLFSLEPTTPRKWSIQRMHCDVSLFSIGSNGAMCGQTLIKC